MAIDSTFKKSKLKFLHLAAPPPHVQSTPGLWHSDFFVADRVKISLDECKERKLSRMSIYQDYFSSVSMNN